MMSAPPTPKIHNKSKRPCPESLLLTPPSTSGSSSNNRRSLVSTDAWLDCQSLQRSLKRLKVTSLTASPGELRLQRDLKHAVQAAGWICLGGRQWNVPSLELTVWQSLDDPLQLGLTWPGHQLALTIPRLYPHRPPEIKVLACHRRRISKIHVQATPDDVVAFQLAKEPSSVVISGWTPLLRLDELVQLTVQQIAQWLSEHCDTKMPCALEDSLQKMQLEPDEADCATEVPNSLVVAVDGKWVMPPQSPRGRLFFPPNRFDLGYDRSLPVDRMQE